MKKGDLLLEIDPRDYQTKLDQAKAALEAGEARLKEAQTGVELTRANRCFVTGDRLLEMTLREILVRFCEISV